jgi:hypothetical protein
VIGACPRTTSELLQKSLDRAQPSLDVHCVQ